MIWNKQFKYPNSQRSIKGEYDITNMLLPSVTTVLNATQPESKRKSLDRWIARTGEDEATRIKELAGKTGNRHAFLFAEVSRSRLQRLHGHDSGGTSR